ncbi:MAG TPA: hypothetical protein VFQ65_10765 [Kofleriaceae bacterium]|nr:hypothetical protein [Kofleriaceae bacterium]
MKTLAALLVVLSSGCLCGGYTGGGDQVLARNTDSIILCENGGFIATTASVIEGRYITDADATITGTRGDDATTAFVLTWSTDRTTATTTDLGDGTWTKRDMNMVELDHADVQCQDLVSRSWWSAQ